MKYLILWLVTTNLILGYLLYVSFSDKKSVNEITVKRINVVGEDGLPRIVISNEKRQHSGRIEGKDIPERDRPAGIIFFNNEGNESGGIISMVQSQDGKVNSGMSFTMDRYNHDQVIQILNNEMYQDGDEKIQRGFLISEFPKGAKFFKLNEEYEEIKKIEDKDLRNEKVIDLLRREGAKKRIYLGRSFNRESGLTLYDQAGTPVLKIFVDGKGKPKIRFADVNGKMVDLIKAEK